MENVTQRDREILREVATRKAELAHSKRNDEILAMWQKQAQGVRDTPTVRLLFSNFTNEVLNPRMRCEGKDARRLERVDAIWQDYLSKWKNLRKLSVSPFNNEPQVGEYLRGTRVVYYSKPRAEYVTNPGALDEDAIRKYFKGVCEAANGCLFEMAQREVGTIFGDYERGRRYVQLARESINAYWQP